MDGAATPVNWGHQLAPAGTAGVINQPDMEGEGAERWGRGRAAQLASSAPYPPGLGPLPGRSHPHPFLIVQVTG